MSSRNHVYELHLLTDERKNPDDAEYHCNGQALASTVPNDFFVVIGAVFILHWSDFIHCNYTNETKTPEDNSEQAGEEVVNCNKSDSLSSNHEVSGGVNDCYGNLQF